MRLSWTDSGLQPRPHKPLPQALGNLGHRQNKGVSPQPRPTLSLATEPGRGEGKEGPEAQGASAHPKPPLPTPVQAPGCPPLQRSHAPPHTGPQGQSYLLTSDLPFPLPDASGSDKPSYVFFSLTKLSEVF